MRKRFLNDSLSKKILFMSVLMMIFPLLFAGILISAYFLSFSVKNSYRSTWQVLDRALEKLEMCWVQTEAIRNDCVFNYPLQRLGNGEAKREDYVAVKNYFNSLVERSSIYETICMVQDGRILMQGGAYIENVGEEFRNEMEEFFFTYPKEYEYWTMSPPMEWSPYVKYAHSGNILTYCGAVDNFLSADFSDRIGILYVNIKEEDLYHIYGDFFEETSQESFLIDADGYVLSARQKDRIGKKVEEAAYFTKNPQNRHEGNFWNRGKLYIYKYSPVINGYLVNVYSYNTYFSGIMLVCTIIGIAILSCILFVFIYAALQRRYIVRPIFELVERFGRIEKGELQRIDCEERHDEIGILQASYNKMVVRLQEMIEEIRQIGDQKKEAQLKTLISQINPHFLYNTLDSIHWKAIRNKDGEVAEQVLALSDVYRYVLSRGREFITFQEELDFQEKYLYLMKMRFGERLCYESYIEESLRELYFPKLIIQPLLENAIIHGIEPKVEGGSVEVRIWLDGEDVCIRIEDTGVGFLEDIALEDKKIAKLEGSLAIKNVYSRLCLYYRENCHFTIYSRKNRGCSTEIRVRYEEIIRDNEINGSR